MKFKIYKGWPFAYHVSKDGYWQISEEKICEENTSQNLSLEKFLSPSYDVQLSEENVPILHFPEQKFPNLKILPPMDYFCLAPKGNYYLSVNVRDMQIVGSPFSQDEDIADNFSTQDYIYINKKVPPVTTFKFICKISYRYCSGINTILSGHDYSNINLQITGANKLYFEIQNACYNGKTSLQNKKEYWLALEYDGTTFGIYMLEDNQTYDISTLPDFSTAWSKEISTVNTFPAVKQFVIGALSTTRYNICEQKIYMNQTKIWINQELWFSKTSVHPEKYIKIGILAPDVPTVSPTYYVHLFQSSASPSGYALTADTKEHLPDTINCGYLTPPPHNPITAAPISVKAWGNPLILDDEVQFFNRDNYLYTEKLMPKIAPDGTNKISYVTKIICRPQDTEDQIGFSLGRANLFMLHNDELCFQTETGDLSNGWQITYDKAFWIQGIDTLNQGYRLYVLEDNGTYTVNTLPQLSHWKLVAQIPQNIFTQQPLYIGAPGLNRLINSYWGGKVNLLQTRIIADDVLFWTPLQTA